MAGISLDCHLKQIVRALGATGLMLSSMEARFQKNAELHKSYVESMKHYLKSGHLRPVEPHYLKECYFYLTMA